MNRRPTHLLNYCSLLPHILSLKPTRTADRSLQYLSLNPLRAFNRNRSCLMRCPPEVRNGML